jgi:hypothetical protein
MLDRSGYLQHQPHRSTIEVAARHQAQGRVGEKHDLGGPAISSCARALFASAIGVALTLSACTDSGSDGSGRTSVFAVQPGECFNSPTKVHAELSKLDRTPCNRAHNQEAYATVGYASSDGSSPSAYPGDDLLAKFAQGACAQRFGRYVGVDYLDSSLFFTYLVPSPRSWESGDDRNVICFITTAGGTLTVSVKGSKK